MEKFEFKGNGLFRTAKYHKRTVYEIVKYEE
jgi:hypothetical protein